MRTTQNKERRLAGSFNDFMNRMAATHDHDYYGQMSSNDFVELKNILANINNIITLRITLAFVEWLYARGIVDADQYAAIRADVENTNANANGFDVQFSDRVGSAAGIVAEIKCNIPVNGARFGAAQLANLKKDVAGLLHGKSKAKGVNPQHYLKFLVLLDVGTDVRPAAEHFSHTMQKSGCRIEISDSPVALHTDTVYIIILKMEHSTKTVKQ